ncbi:MAG: YtxH domain-containing protein [Nitrospirales bacterium]
MSQDRDQSCTAHHVHGGSGGTVALAFVFGILVGMTSALLLAPERGDTLRRRLSKGAKVAGEEFGDVVAETREALEVLSKDARQTLKRTASRLTSALDATKEAIKEET